ncbi:ribosomal protein S27a component of cytosolic 80S ribosome and 40S small subunit [Dunaliella salina]|uniref:Ribosomal protein S27a component of cytosolic 80S ribosome and 40S small subunit n=2 Tax=Eukaryota TaxID=2759 RepID=A0ABQ7GPI6_DUNSA|nr:ribosomal protein S27a component of cytosolic 80S ribosome and 40S small subunit [Dunaliella salina]|eukprot:KAF5836517.1 ribosomal protein S27a component of cytosolic 80S ribosome and 40S small subunit [Dunaliella salina]
MQLFVRTNRTHVVETQPDSTVADVKAIIEAREGLVCDEQRVLFNGKQLEDTELLSLAGVKDEATLNILGRLLGGAKKRKKKTYTKPKKQKHKHKKIKLRVLKFYKVDDSGKVQRMRKQCPQCGPGTFMATHFDRVYCGKCTATFLFEQVPGGAKKPAPKPAAAAPEPEPAAPAKGGKKGKK